MGFNFIHEDYQESDLPFEQCNEERGLQRKFGKCASYGRAELGWIFYKHMLKRSYKVLCAKNLEAADIFCKICAVIEQSIMNECVGSEWWSVFVYHGQTFKTKLKNSTFAWTRSSAHYKWLTASLHVTYVCLAISE